MMMTNRQFVTDARWIRSSDPDADNPFTQLPPDAFFRNYDFIINTKYEKSEDEQLQRLQAAAQILQVYEQSQPGITKADVITEALLRPLVGPNTKKFIRSEEEMAERQRQAAILELQKQEANAVIGAMAPQPNAKPGGVLGGQ